MRTSEYAIIKIKEFEGLKLKAYKPVETEKNYTIGYGHCGPDVGRTQMIDEGYATFLLMRDLNKFERFVNGLSLNISQAQFDALVDFCYNLGTKALQDSTLLKYIKAKKPTKEIQAQFLRWNKAGGKIMRGLTKRRQWEADRWAM